MRKRRRLLSFVSLALAITLLLAISPVRASPGITLERSEEWYGDGDTIVHSVYAEDVDGDSTIEIVTVGEVYNATTSRTEAQMKIWNWNSNMQTLTLEATKEWSLGGSKTVALSVYAADVDDDNNMEIVTAGYGYLQNDFHCDLVVWQYVMGDYTVEHEYSQSVNTIYNSVYATQIDTSDDELEIVIAGVHLGAHDKATLYIETWDQTTMTMKDSVEWGPDDYDANATAVYARNVDADGLVEILTAGYTHVLGTKNAELRVWNYTNSNLNLEDDEPWPGQDTAEALSVYAADVDDDATDIEIMTCGNTVDIYNAVWGDLETFTHDGTDITEDRNEYWQHAGADTECHSVYAGQVNATGFLDIITVGKTIISGIDNGQIKMWNYPATGPGIHVEYDVQWNTTDDTEAHSVYIRDIDADNDVEILSGGQAFDGRRIRAQLRIWYWS